MPPADEARRRRGSGLHRAAERYPKSKFLPDAWVALGENASAAERFDDAEKWLGRATQPEYRTAKTWDRAEYRRAWNSRDNGDCDKSNELFRAVISRDGAYRELARRDVETPCAALDAASPPAAGLAPREIDHAVKVQIAPIVYCYERALPDKPELAGMVVTHLVIGTDGRVSSSSTRSSTLNDATVEACVNDRMAKVRFPARAGGQPATVDYPLLLTSSH